MEVEGDFTFPTVAAPLPAAKAEERQGVGEVVPFPGHSPPGSTATSPLWPFSSSPNTTPPAVDQEEGAPPPRRGEAAAHDQDRMDLLWEDFNFNDDVERRAGPGDRGGHRGPRPSTPPSSSSSDAESEETSGRRRQGCAPTMLRASSRAGGAGQFYASSTRRHRGNRKTSTGWALLMRLFRRLFAVNKSATPTPPPPSRSRRHGIYVP